MKVKIVVETGPNSLLHKSYESKYAIQHGQRAVLGSKTNQICRFCSRTKSQAKFRNKAHVLPEFMGNKSIYSNYECDERNAYFGRLEDSLFNFAGILNTFSMVKGK